MSVADLPAVNAALNGTSLVLLLLGFWNIKRGKKEAHRLCMGSAFLVSILFLACYLWYHAHIGSKPFPGQGWVRPVYFTILLTHTVLAAAIVPLVLVTLSRGLKRQDARHRALARWTLPIWMYVSVTGVVIYLMLYQLY